MGLSLHGTYVGAASQIAVQPFSVASFYTSGNYAASPYLDIFNPQACILATGINLASAFILSKETSFDRIAVSIVTPQVGGKVRLAIYDSLNNYPNKLIVETGELAGDAVAIVEDTISETLSAGLYFLVIKANMNNIETSSYYPGHSIFGAGAPDMPMYDSYELVEVYGAFGATALAGGTLVAYGQVIWLRVA